MAKIQDFPRRPARLEYGCAWVSVVRAEGSGVPAIEKAWCTELLIGSWSIEAKAIDCAKDWYDQTDQCSEAEVELRIEMWDFRAYTVTVKLAPEVVGRVKASAVEIGTPREGGEGSQPLAAPRRSEEGVSGEARTPG